MKKSKYEWKVKPKEELPQEFLQATTAETIEPLFAQLLWNRGIKDSQSLATFLHPTYENLHDPFLMHDMEKSVERIQQAVENGEPILVYGDYDADGITSTTVMKEAIELIGGEVSYFLPNRFIHGYGPNLSVFQEQIEAGIKLIITVDNGVAGHAAIEYATEQGIDVIVTDHHELPPNLPNAFSIVHPKHPSGNYPFGELAGVGVAFKVATALLGELPVELLDLVAIGTIADLVSLTDENRVLVKMGLEVIRTSERIGLDALLQAGKISKETVSEENIGFAIGPRLNALGRLGEAAPGVELLSTFDEEQAQEIAQFIQKKNEERKEIVQKITKEALALIDEEESVHIVARQGWHEGVLGIVAGRIMQETGKPAIVLTIDEKNEIAKGSGRSIPAFNLYEALNEVRDLFTHFGGHHMAAGMTLSAAHLAEVKQHLVYKLKQEKIDVSQRQELIVDAELSLADVTIDFIQKLSILAPFGTDNPVPYFSFNHQKATQVKQIGADKAHLKFMLTDETASLDAVAFGFGEDVEELMTNSCCVAGQLSINEWNGNKKPQLMVNDLAIEGNQLFDFRGKANQQKLPMNKTVLSVIFHEKKIKQQQAFPNSVHFSTVDELLRLIEQKGIKELIFVDCPDEIELVKELVQKSQLQRIFLVFASAEEAYLNGIGTREQFARVYQFIGQQAQIDVRYKLPAVAQYLKIPENLLIFMIKVFFDLGFVKIDNGVLTKVAQPENKPLTESKVYQQRLRQIEAEKFLLYSDLATLQHWLWNEEEM